MFGLNFSNKSPDFIKIIFICFHFIALTVIDVQAIISGSYYVKGNRKNQYSFNFAAIIKISKN